MSNPSPSVTDGERAALFIAGASALALAGWLLRSPSASRSRRHALGALVRDGAAERRVRAALAPPRRLQRATGTLAACVLLDSALEHYRGSFHNRGMFAPLASAALTLAASTRGAASSADSPPHRSADLIYALAGATGLVGLAFHSYNIGKRTGGFSWSNFFYAAPIAAPAALSFAGVLGLAANRLRERHAQPVPRLLGVPAGRALAALTSAGLLGTVGEAALLHFRGSFQNPAMYLPVSVPPVAAVLLACRAAGRARRAAPVTRWWLRMTGLLGLVGSCFHAIGVSRAMGGWRNRGQNLLNGPPLPAPPSFTALAVTGLSALDLLERRAG